MSAPAAGPRQAPLAGMALTAGAGILFPISDAIIKHLADAHHVVQINWARYVFFLLFACLLVFGRRRERLSLRTPRLPLHVLRGLLMLASSLLFLSGLSFMPLADAIAILFVGPLILVAMSGALLGEKVGPARWAAVCVGFAGALLIIRPGLAGFNAASILVLGSASVWACHQVIARKLAATEAAATSLFYVSLVGAAGTTFATPFFWTPPTAQAWLLMALTGTIAAIGQFCVIKAVEVAPVSALAPFNYTQIVCAVLVGFVAFGHWPDLLTLAGAAIVSAAGLAIAAWERARPAP